MTRQPKKRRHVGERREEERRGGGKQGRGRGWLYWEVSAEWEWYGGHGQVRLVMSVTDMGQQLSYTGTLPHDWTEPYSNATRPPQISYQTPGRREAGRAESGE